MRVFYRVKTKVCCFHLNIHHNVSSGQTPPGPIRKDYSAPSDSLAGLREKQKKKEGVGETEGRV